MTVYEKWSEKWSHDVAQISMHAIHFEAINLFISEKFHYEIENNEMSKNRLQVPRVLFWCVC